MATKKKVAARNTESVLTTAAQAVGTAPGKLALKVGVAAPATPAKRKEVKATPMKAPAKKKSK